MASKIMYDGYLGINESLATVDNGQQNILQISGITNNGTVKFETSVNGGSSWVEDETLERNTDGNVTLSKVNAIIKAVVTDVVDASLLKIYLGY